MTNLRQIGWTWLGLIKPIKVFLNLGVIQIERWLQNAFVLTDVIGKDKSIDKCLFPDL